MSNLILHDMKSDEWDFFENKVKLDKIDQIPVLKGVLEERFGSCVKINKEIIGGVIAIVNSNTCFIDFAWIKDSYRHHGYGSCLLMDVESKQ